MLATLLLATLPLTAQPAPPPAAPTPPRPILGFKDAAKQHAIEAQFDAKLNRDNLRTWMQRMSARPHHVGSPYDKENVDYMAALFRSWGFETKVERFDVLFPTPKTRVLEMVAPDRVALPIDEPAIKEDRTSDQVSEILPVYNAYSIDGDVTAEVVYVNYGVPADYEVLARNGVDVRGKIVLARYGGSWRGIKPKVAAEHGAVGCLIYSDPRDDGYYEGDVYPKGGWRPELGAQRGSVMDMPIHPGDPLTPGVGATADAKRLDRSAVTVFTKIPVMPISYAAALPLLRNLGGPMAPSGWRGALATPYRLGAGPARVHLKLEFDWKSVPAYDVIARMNGTDLADQWIVRGNHHDAWVHGARDPLSGMVSLMEEARAISELAKSGWRPRRTLIFAGWGAEEEGLIGSTEWVETHLPELKEHAAIYINSDSNARGFLDAGGSHTLARFVTEVARDVVDPQRNVSVFERLHAAYINFVESVDERDEIRARELIRLEALGSGSDFTPFLQHAGIASLHIGYGGEDEYGVYHSVYDSFDHFTRFDDPNFVYGIVQTKTTGRMMLRLANAETLPFETVSLAETIARYADEVQKLAQNLRRETEDHNRMLRDRTQEIASDPNRTFVAPAAKEAVPHLEFAPLQNAVARLTKAAKAFDGSTSAPNRDRVLMQLERALTREAGLPNRPWYKHHVYAPGFYTGYGVKTLPGVREAIEQRRWREANEQIVIVAKVLEGYAEELEKATPKPTS